MSKLPIDIQIEFFKVINDEVSINDFEQWLYVQNSLEQLLGNKVYIDLISINYKNRHAKHEMCKVIDLYLDYGLFEERKLKKILNDLIHKTDDFAKSLIATYDLYCYGYSFFYNLGLGYGLTFSEDFFDYTEWENLSADQKENRINKIYPGVKREAELVLSWMEQGKLILTGERDELGHYDYIDKRSPFEKDHRNIDVGFVEPDNYANRQTNVFLAKRQHRSNSLLGCLRVWVESWFK